MDKLFTFRDEKDEIDHETQMLIYAFTSAIEHAMEEKDFDRKTLAKLSGITVAKLQAVWRGTIPLTWEMLVRIQRAMNIKFVITAVTENS